jgi:hypothetical protein
MCKAFVIKDADSGEFFCRTNTPTVCGTFDKSLAFAEIYSTQSIADLALIQAIGKNHIRWEDGYRVPRILVVTKVNIIEEE